MKKETLLQIEDAYLAKLMNPSKLGQGEEEMILRNLSYIDASLNKRKGFERKNSRQKN